MSASSHQHSQGAAAAFSGSTREDLIDGNTTKAGGAGGQFSGETTAQQQGHTLGNDFSLRGMKGEREGDFAEPNVLPGESAGTAGPGGDYGSRPVHEHELKGMKQRLERDDERADREGMGYDEPISRMRQPPTA
ncbi:hypothetical protein JCM10207_002202 [Rhodosporidiobolus poonsookiae]